MTNHKCALMRAIYSCGCSEYHHQDGCLSTATCAQHQCQWAPDNQTKDIEGRCLVHDRNVQQEALRLKKLADNYGDSSAAPLLLSKKFDMLLQVCEANTDEIKKVAAQVQAIATNPDANATEVQTAVDKSFNTLQTARTTINTDISAASANDIPLKKALAAAKLHALPITTGVNKLQSEIEKHKGAIRIFFKDTLVDPEISPACREKLERLLEIGWDHFERHLEDAFKRAEENMVKACEEGALMMMASLI